MSLGAFVAAGTLGAASAAGFSSVGTTSLSKLVGDAVPLASELAINTMRVAPLVVEAAAKTTLVVGGAMVAAHASGNEQAINYTDQAFDASANFLMAAMQVPGLGGGGAPQEEEPTSVPEGTIEHPVAEGEPVPSAVPSENEFKTVNNSTVGGVTPSKVIGGPEGTPQPIVEGAQNPGFTDVTKPANIVEESGNFGGKAAESTLAKVPSETRIRTGPNGELQSTLAKINPEDIGNGTPTTDAARDLARRLGNATDDAGHARGSNLGGKGGATSGNIFPQAPSVNRGAFAQFEQQVARQVQAGNEVYIRVVPRYAPGATRPFEISYQVRVNGVTTTRVFPNP